MLRIAALVISVSIILFGCKERERDPEKEDLIQRIERGAVLVKTCPGDPRWATGPTAVAIRFYRYENELWYQDVDGYRRVDAKPETVCAVLTISK
jgi:hypothetical protein